MYLYYVFIYKILLYNDISNATNQTVEINKLYNIIHDAAFFK